MYRVTVMVRLLVVLAAAAVLVAACDQAVVVSATPTDATTAPPTTSLSTPVPTAAPASAEPSIATRPSLPPDAPTIADPYWLLVSGTDTFSISDAGGQVVQTTNGVNYHVFEGGGMEGTILVNGLDRAFLTVNITTGADPIPGINPIETQYGAQIDDVLPDPSVPSSSPTPDNPDIWTRTTHTRGGNKVYVRTADGPLGAGAEAYWWGDEAGGQWFVLAMQFGEEGFEDILTALLGPAA